MVATPRPRGAGREPAARLVELRVLDGPNLYFTRPAIKLTLAVPGWLAADEERLTALAPRSGLNRPPQPGPRQTEQRRRAVLRIAVQVTRALAEAAGTRIAVRGRAGDAPEEIVVAFPWRRRGTAEALGNEIAGALALLPGSRRSLPRVAREAGRRLAAVDPGPGPTVPDPTIPVVQVTGTNGKTTTVRLLAHLARSAGMRVAYTSTDGVFLEDRLVEGGDYSGFGGAALALAQPGVEAAILETARGGILLRGIGVLYNDVSVVTNVSEDHLDLHGIRTLDQLAEVKATITRITRPQGWHVLNADDPRVLAMRRGAKGRPWLLSTDPDHPALRDALAEGGRATTVIDGAMVVQEPGSDPHPLLALEDVPVTIAGISTHNVQNAMAAASAALGVGLPERTVVKGLRTFVPDPERNPGRANLFACDGRVVVVDYAHNEAGMLGLTELCEGTRRHGAEVWIAFCTAGDRTDRIMHRFGHTAARSADHVAIAELQGYLRGRERQDVIDRLRAGAIDGGATEVPVFPDEVHALGWMLASSNPGDVLAVTALGQRPEVFALLERRGAERLTPGAVRRLVRRVRVSRGSSRRGGSPVAAR